MEVSRTFEPAPKVKVEARYTLYFAGDALVRVALSKRNQRTDKPTNPQFSSCRALDPEDVPDGVLREASDRLQDAARSADPETGVPALDTGGDG